MDNNILFTIREFIKYEINRQNKKMEILTAFSENANKEDPTFTFIIEVSYCWIGKEGKNIRIKRTGTIEQLEKFKDDAINKFKKNNKGLSTDISGPYVYVIVSNDVKIIL